jgi:hypothetical protein
MSESATVGLQELYPAKKKKKVSATSKDAHDSIKSKKPDLRQMVFKWLETNGPAIQQEAVDGLPALQPSTVRSRMAELQKAEKIRKTGKKRLTRSGRNADEYEVIPQDKVA